MLWYAPYKTTVEPRAWAEDIPVFCRYDELISPQDLKPNPQNPNTHSEKQIGLLGKIIKEQGWRAPITVSKRSGYIVKGHGRLEAAFMIDSAVVPVEYQDYESKEAEHADMIADNKIAEFSEMDKELLDMLMVELNDAEFDLMLTGFDEYFKEIETMVAEVDQTEVFENRQNQTGEMDLNDFHEESYDNCCPKCGFRW